ncbi:hypothetical protein [Flaviflagellibacter deserti]|uniref:PepSY domain-containing protein n=1 Tax=Flaviflagellibacter deserti TaxID=2267266 RepID=A0ABV9Z0I5_9HYPH
MTTRKIMASAAAATMLLVSAPAFARDYHRHHHRDGNGAAVGAALGAGVFLGALAASSAANADPYYPPPPPPPAPAYYGPDRGYDETADEAVNACRQGLLDVARRHGAYDAEIDRVDYVRETPDGGHRIRAEITMIYPRDERTSEVVCHTADGMLVSARTE